MTTIKYITNKDLIAEIHRSKVSYSHFERPEYSRFDAIVNSVDDITTEFLEAILTRKLEIVAKKGPAIWAGMEGDGPMNIERLIIRVMCDKHIPEDENLN